MRMRTLDSGSLRSGRHALNNPVAKFMMSRESVGASGHRSSRLGLNEDTNLHKKKRLGILSSNYKET